MGLLICLQLSQPTSIPQNDTDDVRDSVMDFHLSGMFVGNPFATLWQAFLIG